MPLLSSRLHACSSAPRLARVLPHDARVASVSCAVVVRRPPSSPSPTRRSVFHGGLLFVRATCALHTFLVSPLGFYAVRDAVTPPFPHPGARYLFDVLGCSHTYAYLPCAGWCTPFLVSPKQGKTKTPHTFCCCAPASATLLAFNSPPSPSLGTTPQLRFVVLVSSVTANSPFRFPFVGVGHPPVPTPACTDSSFHLLLCFSFFFSFDGRRRHVSSPARGVVRLGDGASSQGATAHENYAHGGNTRTLAGGGPATAAKQQKGRVSDGLNTNKRNGKPHGKRSTAKTISSSIPTENVFDLSWYAWRRAEAASCAFVKPRRLFFVCARDV